MADAQDILDLARGKFLLAKMANVCGPELWPYVHAEMKAGAPITSDTPDEPLEGNRFRYAGQVHEMRPVPWKLLNALWGHDARNMHDVEDEIWEVGGGSQLGDAKHDLKTFLEGIGYPSYVSKARGSDSLVWKAF